MTKEELDWWSTIDMKDKFLSKLWFQMFGTAEQRVKQLFIVRNTLNLKKNDINN